MTAREIPGALALGLLASLLAHMALYGGGHAMGGAYHEVLFELAVAGGSAFGIALGAVAWKGARRAADGSILASRLAVCVPGWAPLGASAALWFALGERLDAPHSAAGLLLTAAALAGAAWLCARIALAAVRLLAGAVLRLVRLTFAPRPIARRVALPAVPAAYRTPPLRRRFARPPPIARARA